MFFFMIHSTQKKLACYPQKLIKIMSKPSQPIGFKWKLFSQKPLESLTSTLKG